MIIANLSPIKKISRLSALLLVAGIVSACSSTPRQPVEPAPRVAVAKPIQLTPTPRGPMLTLNDVLFDFDQDTLRPEANGIVKQAAAWLKANPDRKAVVQGHTDQTGPAEFNQGLSERRALAVRDALLKQGVPAARIESKGYGMTRPVASHDTREGRQANRRVEIVFTLAGGKRPA